MGVWTGLDRELALKFGNLDTVFHPYAYSALSRSVSHTMSTKTVARIRTADDRRFIVDRTMGRRPHGARKAEGTLYEVTDGGRNKLQTLDAHVHDIDVVLDAAKDALGFYTDADIETFEQVYP